MAVESMPVNVSSQIEPHVPFKRISTRPELLEIPLTSLISERMEKQIIYKHVTMCQAMLMFMSCTHICLHTIISRESSKRNKLILFASTFYGILPNSNSAFIIPNMHTINRIQSVKKVLNLHLIHFSFVVKLLICFCQHLLKQN